MNEKAAKLWVLECERRRLQEVERYRGRILEITGSDNAPNSIRYNIAERTEGVLEQDWNFVALEVENHYLIFREGEQRHLPANFSQTPIKVPFGVVHNREEASTRLKDIAIKFATEYAQTRKLRFVNGLEK